VLSELQKKKLRHLFEVYDVHANGVLERDDYELLAHAAATERGFRPSSPEHERITRAFLTQFERMKAIADVSRDGRISPAEWLEFFDIVLHDEEAFGSVVGATVDILFELFDLDRDDVLDRAELASLRRAFGVMGSDNDALFAALDQNGDDKLSAAEVRDAIERFFRRDDPDDPANLFFGPLPD
jgi:Ca2+-binding EF-hand superfamily protein